MVVSYEKLYQINIPFGDILIVVSVDKEVPFGELPEIAQTIKASAQFKKT